MARQVIANMCLSNMAIMPWEDRLKVKPGDDDMWMDSVILRWNREVESHLFLAPEQSGKSGETASMCAYHYLVCGVVPVVTVRSSGGRMAGGDLMQGSLNDLLSEAAKERGFVPSIKDYIQKSRDHPDCTSVTHIDCQYFYLKAQLKPAGMNSLSSRLPGEVSPLEIPILLQNAAAIRHMHNMMNHLDDSYGPRKGNEGETKSRAAFINDEDDLNFAGATGMENNTQLMMNDVRLRCIYDISVTATGNTILMTYNKPQLYIRHQHPANYYGIASNRIEWKEFTIDKIRNEPCLLPSTFRVPQYGQMFPQFGDRARLALEGKSGTKADGDTLNLAKRVYVDMVNRPNAVLDGWRHANCVIRRADHQQYAAVYFASLRACPYFVTMEWHSLGVRTTKINDLGKFQVAFYMSVDQWSIAKEEWKTHLAMDTGKPKCKELSLSVDRLCNKEGIIAAEPTDKQQDKHHDVVMVALDPEISFRFAITLMEMLWRPDGAFEATPHALSRGRNVRFMVFSGEINGRQMPNKALDHGTLLTDQIYKVNVGSDGLSANIAGSTASQQISRVCGVTSQSPLNNNPAIWCTDETKDYIEEHHQLQHELCRMTCERQGDSANLFDSLKDITLDRSRYPKLSLIKDRIEIRLEGNKNKSKPPSIQIKNLAPTPRAAKAIGQEFQSTQSPVHTGALVSIEDRLPSVKRPEFDSAAPGEAPKDPAAAREYRKYQLEQRHKSVLTSLKSSASRVFLQKGRIESGLESWKCIMEYYGTNHLHDGENIPDFAVSIPQDEIPTIAGARDDLQKAVSSFFEGGHQFQNLIQACHITDAAPGGLFRRHDNGWVMANFLQDKLTTLDQRRAKGNGKRSMRQLWMGAGKHASQKGSVVMRSIFRRTMSRFVSEHQKLPSPAQVGFLTGLTKNELESIFRDANYSNSWGIKVFVTSDDHSAWSCPVIVGNAGDGDAGVKSSSRFSLTTDILQQIHDVQSLTFDNLKDDFPTKKRSHELEDNEQSKRARHAIFTSTEQLTVQLLNDMLRNSVNVADPEILWSLHMRRNDSQHNDETRFAQALSRVDETCTVDRETNNTGDCMFDAVLRQLKYNDYPADRALPGYPTLNDIKDDLRVMREAVCQLVGSNPDIQVDDGGPGQLSCIRDFMTEYGDSPDTPEHWCSRMQRGWWGDHIALQSLAFMFNVNIKVLDADDTTGQHDTIIQPTSSGAQALGWAIPPTHLTLLIVYTNKCHYMATTYKDPTDWASPEQAPFAPATLPSSKR